MKRRFISLMIVLILTLTLTFPVCASSEQEFIYDETSLLTSDELLALGNTILPQFVDTYDVDLRVDILTGIGDFSDVNDAAEYIYSSYGYGGSDGRGVSITLLADTTENDVMLVDWSIYFGGGSDWSEYGPRCIPEEVYDLLSDEAWSGDAAEDADVLADVIVRMVAALEYYLDNEPSTNTTEAVSLDYVTDAAGLLSAEQWQELEVNARAISEQYGVGVYVITVEDYRSYTSGDIYDAADVFYHGCSLGLGDDRDCLLLLLSMDDRDYNLIAYGDFAQYAFDDPGRERMVSFFLDDFASNNWYQGFSDYLSWSGDYLAAARSGEPYTYGSLPMTASDRFSAIMIRVAVILLVPLLIAGIYILILSAQMKSVAKAEGAANYMDGNLRLILKSDRYTHTTQSRRKVSSSSSGSRSSSGRSSGGGSGTSGKF